MLALIPLIPLLPLVGFVFCGLAGRKVSKGVVAAVACGAVGLSFLLSVGAVLELRSLRPEAGEHGAGLRHYEAVVWEWIPVGAMTATNAAPGETAEPASPSTSNVRIPLAFALDPLSAVMILVVTGVGFLIHLYSAGYMHSDDGFGRYFAYLNLFTAMMLTLVLGANFLVMFVGWEGVGLCSYLLIGFWYADEAKADAGRKAFITNRIGDFGFILGILGILALFGTLDFAPVMSAIETGAAGPAGVGALAWIALALFVGACGKSAQIPLYVWLPDAMAGPTPVSALIHAATMVTAGVYMVSRCSALFLHVPAVLTVVAIVGAATAFLAATIGLAQNDIKKVLAYSTVSQLGLMFLAAGVGAFAASIFHLVTHAFFKALLFLGSGSVIHAMGGEQDMRRMGGLKDRLPVTYWTFLVGSLAIAGIPPLAGFFSKDEILAATWGAGRPLLWVAGTVVSLCTAFYMFRLVMLTFHGRFRGTAEQEHHLHESPPAMTIPLVVLAILSVVGGWIGIPAALGHGLGIPNVLEHWLAPALAHDLAPVDSQEPPVVLLMLVATAVAAAGIGAAVAFYRPGSTAPSAAARLAGPFYDLVANAWWVDDLYDATVLRLYRMGSAAMDAFDRVIVDGAVNAAGVFAQTSSQLVRLAQTGLVRHYALLFLVGCALLMWYFIWP